MNDIRVRGMTEDDWPEVSEFIATEWETNHPVIDKEFFFWQHKGFGAGGALSATPLAFSGGQLVGMRGVIPGEYQVPRGRGGYQYVRGGAFAMWLVAESSRGIGVGGRLLDYCQARLSVMTALGSNENTSVPIYLKNGFRRLSGLHHWYAILSEPGQQLIFNSSSHEPLARPLPFPARVALEPITDSNLLAGFWSSFSQQHPTFAVHRTNEFWSWRYLEHPVFNYEIVANAEVNMVAVYRDEETKDSGATLRVRRVVELFGDYSPTSSDGQLTGAGRFVASLVSAAIEAGLDALDFRCSDKVMNRALDEGGLTLMPWGLPDQTGRGFAGRLQPLLLSASPINMHWKSATLAAENLYFTKSDSDMDRPNIRGIRSSRLPDE